MVDSACPVCGHPVKALPKHVDDETLYTPVCDDELLRDVLWQIATKEIDMGGNLFQQLIALQRLAFTTLKKLEGAK